MALRLHLAAIIPTRRGVRSNGAMSLLLFEHIIASRWKCSHAV